MGVIMTWYSTMARIIAMKNKVDTGAEKHLCGCAKATPSLLRLTNGVAGQTMTEMVYKFGATPVPIDSGAPYP